MTLNVFEGHSPIQAFSSGICVQHDGCDVAHHVGLSVIAEPFVVLDMTSLATSQPVCLWVCIFYCSLAV